MKYFSLLPVFAGLAFSLHAHASLADLNQLKAPFQLPALPYAEDALAAVIDAETMRIHHGLHHKTYVDKLNEALPSEKGDLLAILRQISKRPEAVRNNAGGHWNHSFFWTVLSPKADEQKMPEALGREIAATFGSFEKFQAAFEKAGADRFGSGWAWLIRNPAGKLEVTSTPNQDNPLMDVAPKKGTPILGADVWEHAYYLKYQNRRAEYLKSFWKVVNWKQVAEYDAEAKTAKK